MRTCDIARNRKSKTSTAFILITRIIEPQERLEYFFAQTRRDTWAVVIHCNGEIAVITVAGNCDRGRVARSIGNEICEATFECRRAHGNDRRPMKYDSCLVTMTFSIEP